VVAAVSEFASIRDAMETRFPYADLRAYFAFIDTAAGSGKYRHHVAPKCEFPELRDSEDNIALLNYEDHKQAHQLLSEAVPEHTGFRLAAIYMFAYESSEYEKRTRLNGQAAVESGQLARAREKQGYEGLYAALEKGRASMTPEEWRAGSRKGGLTQAAADARERSRITNEISGWANCEIARESIDLAKRYVAQVESGRRAATSGQLAAARESLGYKGLCQNMAKGAHSRWHVQRGINSPTCAFCFCNV
jgi:hypothetical protein